MRRAINLAGKFYPRLTNQVNRTMIGSFVVQSQSAAVNRILVRTCKTAASDKPSDSQGKNEETDSKDSRSERTDVAVFDHDNYDDYYEPKTAGEKVSFYTVLSLRMLLLLAGVACVVVTARELFPGRLGPQNLFSEAFEVVKLNDEV